MNVTKKWRQKMYSLEGVDGNVFAIIGYVNNALQRTGHKDLCKEYQQKAMSGDYNNAISVSLDYLDIVNEGLRETED